MAETFGSRAASTVALDPELGESKSTPSATTVGSPSLEAQATRKESQSQSFLSMLLIDFLLFPLEVCMSYSRLELVFESYLLWALDTLFASSIRF